MKTISHRSTKRSLAIQVAVFHVEVFQVPIKRLRKIRAEIGWAKGGFQLRHSSWETCRFRSRFF